MRRADGYHVVVELSETAKLALPMILAQFGQIAMMIIDLALIGRIGTEEVAAAALAGRLYYLSVLYGMGLLVFRC